MLTADIDVWVLGHHAKQCVTAALLNEAGIGFTLYENPDWEFPEDHPELATSREEFPAMRGYALRQFRAYRGHQEICRRVNKPYALVFEDDAGANCSTADWTNLIKQSVRFLGEPYGYDAVSLHGRELSRPFTKQIQLLGRTFVELGETAITANGHLYFLRPARRYWPQLGDPLHLKRHHGCLAYLIGEQGRQKWINAGHGGGLPCDLFLANILNTIVCDPTPFDHLDVQAGSLIDNRGQCRRKLSPDGTAVENGGD